ncbi:hypothetical protein ACRAWF_30960 [Streptomyces sp. L7]
MLLSGDAASRAALDRMVVAYAQETSARPRYCPPRRRRPRRTGVTGHWR